MPTQASSIDLKGRVALRGEVLRLQYQQAIYRQTDRLFVLLLAIEWLAGIVVALWFSPRAWRGLESSVHPHVWAAIFLGGAIAGFPILLALANPGAASTRYVISAAQLLYSGLLIHLCGGRIETHFHIFGSLAFLGFYRDWRVLVPATLVVSLDHALRGTFWPQSVFGVSNANSWRWIEHGGWVIFEDIFLVWSCIRGARELALLASRQAELEAINERVEAEVATKTERLESVTQQLISTARRAGMAEIATGVLHNVGNVLNSVNVSATVAARTVRESEVGTLIKAGEMLKSHQQDMSSFLTTDQRGMQLPAFFIELADCIGQEQATLLSEFMRMEDGLNHIKQIVSDQQRHAKNGTFRQKIDPAELFQQAIVMDDNGRSNVDYQLEQNFEAVGPADIDKHKILQILVNLLNNARRAVKDSSRPDKRIVASIRLVEKSGLPRLEFAVADNGIGIEPQNIARIFTHGFTTRAEGHGFGLHSAANEASQMGGVLRVWSAGLGEGSTFTLELPLSGATEAGQLITREGM